MPYQDLLYPKLSYEIGGAAFDVYNCLGAGHNEKYYQRALEESFIEKGLKFKREVKCPLNFKSKVVGRRFVDFIVEGKVIIELKKGDRFAKTNIDQVLDYLKLNNLKLAILINFGSKGVQFKRIVNLY